ncbi:MAG TPA: UDP-N-acetylmuramate--L-alanine ligase [Bacteroidales bacterium]|mgnify:CR=1 FL=1|nr:UDP-N-acetylmuramate--L-alanine ligase [Bacteroidales bacterium]
MSIFSKHIIYFIGIGGIGMSALAKYFLRQGKIIVGYDRSESPITMELENAGAYLHYSEDIESIPTIIRSSSNNDMVVVYTPAVSTESPLIKYIKGRGLDIYKRAEVLGMICNNYSTVAVAGTHGKTTVSSLIAHVIHCSQQNGMAFLGGIVKNYQSNFINCENPKYVVAEADEYDRSFLQLSPEAAVITAIDADHLDIYKTYDALKQAYSDFVAKIIPSGKLLLKKEIAFIPQLGDKQVAYYSTHHQADCTIENLQLDNGYYIFDVKTPWGKIDRLKPGITGDYNVENVLAAVSMCLWLGIDKEQVKKAVEGFNGVKRRFDVQLNNENNIYIDDYAHHPEEIRAFVQSVRNVFPGKKITGIFQPHLYSRTRDLADEFSASLSLLDELWLMDIYPARELPIEGVTSKIIFDKVTCPTKIMVEDNKILDLVQSKKPPLLLTMGAGNIDQWVQPIKQCLNEK